jgi:hypothetical protein
MWKTILCVFVAACGAGVKPPVGPGPEPTDTTPHHPVLSHAANEVAVGVMCPDRAAGRPAVSLIAARQPGHWSTDDEELRSMLERGQAGEFSVLSFRGVRAGIFDSAGAIESDKPIATGSYAGRGPCELRPGATPEPECTAMIGTCGLAVAAVTGGQADAPPDLAPGSACLEKGRLHVDIDGDGKAEVFEIDDFIGDNHAPASEVAGQIGTASPAGCTQHFAIPNAIAPAPDPKIFRGGDIAAITDLDGDGRVEIVLQLRYGDTSTWAIFSANESAMRLELVAEGDPWATETVGQ